MKEKKYERTNENQMADRRWRILAPSLSGGLLHSTIVTAIVEPSAKLIRSSDPFSSNFWTTRSLIAWVSLVLTDIVILR